MRSVRAKVWFILLVAVPLLAACIAIYAENVSLHWGFSTLHNRYTFTINFGRLWIHCSPPAKHTPAEVQAWEELKRLRNDDLELTVFHSEGASLAEPLFRTGSIGSKLQQLRGVSDQPFLRALDSPNKFVAALVLLDERHSSTGGAPPIWFIDHRNGVPLLSLGHPTHGKDWPVGISRHVAMSQMRIDVDLLDEYRNIWHEKLDQSIVSLNVWWIVAVTFIPALLVTTRFLRRKSRVRAGRCVRCGYDLRASTGVCPECGAPIPKNAATPSTV